MSHTVPIKAAKDIRVRSRKVPQPKVQQPKICFSLEEAAKEEGLLQESNYSTLKPKSWKDSYHKTFYNRPNRMLNRYIARKNKLLDLRLPDPESGAEEPTPFRMRPVKKMTLSLDFAREERAHFSHPKVVEELEGIHTSLK